jgi:opacity protein-like surface antigen
MRKVLLAVIVLLFGSAAFAQDTPKFEAWADYSYFRFNPQHSGYVNSASLNGGGGGVAYYFTHMIGIEADFQGYGSVTQNYHIPATVPQCGAITEGTSCNFAAQANAFSYNVGPVIKFRSKHFEPFAEVEFGGVHSNTFKNLCTQFAGIGGACATRNPSNNAFDFIIGGGIDVPVTKSIAIRVAEADFVLTRFGNAITGGNNNQSNFRYNAGVVFRF